MALLKVQLLLLCNLQEKEPEQDVVLVFGPGVFGLRGVLGVV